MITARRLLHPVHVAAAGLLALSAVTAVVATATPASAAPTTPAAPGWGTAAPGQTFRACAAPTAGRAACLAEAVAGRVGVEPAAATITGLRPADITAAYALTGRSTATVAIVDAYDNPNAEADLAVYRKKWGLPACTTANGCFRKVNQRGDATPLPEPDAGWGLEIALDLDAASAACPSCKLLLVEGDSSYLDDLGAAVNTAVTLGAAVVSNSYGADEFRGVASYAKRYYAHPGVPIVASSGDFGFGPASFPAVATTVIGVGGTTLVRSDTTRGWTETAWSAAGSGCSAYVAKPAFQSATGDHCLMRTVSDVSAVADPETGLAVYDTFGTADSTPNGWLQVGGTSLSAPLLAAMIARAGHTARYADASSLYTRSGSFTDVVGGRNGYCGRDYLCTGLRGYDAPTGIGTPAGLGGL